MSVKRYDLDGNADGYFDDPFMKLREDGKFILHSDYATLLARHNALVERFTEMHQSVEYSEMALYERTLGYNALVEAVRPVVNAWNGWKAWLTASDEEIDELEKISFVGVPNRADGASVAQLDALAALVEEEGK